MKATYFRNKKKYIVQTCYIFILAIYLTSCKIFGNFVDKHYEYDASRRLPSQGNRINNNTINYATEWKGVTFDPEKPNTSPWLQSKVSIITGKHENKKIFELDGPVPNYKGEVFKGGNGGRSYRTQKETIMGDARRMTPQEWENGFLPV